MATSSTASATAAKPLSWTRTDPVKTIPLYALFFAPGLVLAADQGTDLEYLRAEHARVLEQITPGAMEPSEPHRQLKAPPGSLDTPSGVDIGAMVEQFNRAQRGEGRADSKRQAGLYAFVSLSVPEPVLRSIARDVKKAGGTMVLRGFKEETNMGATAAALQAINEGVGAEWALDPDLFAALKIEKVPALAVVMEKPEVSICEAEDQPQGGCAAALDAAVAYGDISVPHAMRRILAGSKQPEIQAQARAVLAKVEAKPQ